MIRHIVMFIFSDAQGPEAKKAIIEAAREKTLSLKDKIDFVRNIDVKVNANNEDKRNYDFANIIDFDCIEDIDKYVNHPEHMKVAEFTNPYKVSRACLDYEL